MRDVFGPLLIFLLMLAGTPNAKPDPDWIVIFELKRDLTKDDPLLNIRVVSHASSEGEAVLKSTLWIQQKFGVNSTESLTFIEAARSGDKK